MVEVYTGNTPYRVQLTDSGGTLIPGMDFDEIIGALDTSVFVTDPDIVPSNPITNTSSNQAPALADKGKFYNIDCSGGNVTVTHIAAATLGNGWFAKYRHDGTANKVLITGTSSELFKIGSHAGVTQFALTERGQAVVVTCDGTGFKVEQSSPALFNTTGVILIADRLSTPPGSPQAGARYIVTAAPTGAWSTFAEHDIAEYTGAGWFKITPPADCGWLAWVQDENAVYWFNGSAWAAQTATAAETLTGTDTFKAPSVAAMAANCLKLLASGTVSDAAALDIVLTSYTSYRAFKLIFNNFRPATDDVQLWLRFSTDGGANFDASGYNNVLESREDTDAAATVTSGSGNQIVVGGAASVGDAVGSAATEGISGSLEIFEPSSVAAWTKCMGLSYWIDADAASEAFAAFFGGSREAAQNTDAIRLLFESGNIASGNWALYGYA